MSRQSWSSEEDQAITKLVEQYGIEDWTKIACKLRDHLGMQRRTGKQCRERWYNHLSPTVNKQPWTEREEELLFAFHKNYGNRWKDISKLFVGRTDNDIKNHFYSTLRRSLRRLNKIVGEKNSTTQMRQIKPSVLSTIMNFIYENEQSQIKLVESLKDLPILIFQFAKFKPIKVNIKNTNIELIRQKTYQIFSLISSFNEQYERNKAERRVLQGEKLRRKSSAYEEIKVKYQYEIKIQDHFSELEDSKSLRFKSESQQNPQLQSKQKEMEDNSQKKYIEKTQFTLNYQQQYEDLSQSLNMYNMSVSPKLIARQPTNQIHHHRTFSLEADQINDMDFHEPEQPSKINIYENNQFDSGNDMQQQDRSHHSQLVDEVIETHFDP